MTRGSHIDDAQIEAVVHAWWFIDFVSSVQVLKVFRCSEMENLPHLVGDFVS